MRDSQKISMALQHRQKEKLVLLKLKAQTYTKSNGYWISLFFLKA